MFFRTKKEPAELGIAALAIYHVLPAFAWPVWGGEGGHAQQPRFPAQLLITRRSSPQKFPWFGPLLPADSRLHSYSSMMGEPAVTLDTSGRDPHHCRSSSWLLSSTRS